MRMQRASAIQDYKQARRRAAMQEVLGRLGGRPQELLSFEEARKAIGEVGQFPRGLQDIPLDAIVGSVGRYEDFNRQFLPRENISAGRWANIRVAAEYEGLPPIEVFQLGEAYFVHDGHHRVSVARQLGAKSIEAYVTEIPTKTPLSPEDDAEDLILKAEQAAFFEETRLAKLHPEVDLTVTKPGRYRQLREHIAVHQYFMGLDEQRDISFEEAVQHWLDQVYLPAMRAIRRLDWLADFPNRTEADMYLWLMKHRADLAKELGWELGTDEVAAHMWNRLYTKPRRLWERLRRWLASVLPFKWLQMDPMPTQWSLNRGQLAAGQRLFSRILVPISGDDASWTAVDLALQVAHKEGAELRGVHVVPAKAPKESPAIDAIRVEFERRLGQAGLRGRLVVEQGNISRRVGARSHWSDLVVLHLKHPPGTQPMQRLLSGLRAFLSRSPRPALVVSQASPMQHALLAYDGSRKANEALYLAAYLAAAWGTRITVLTSRERSLRESLNLQKAKGYLIALGVEAEYVSERGPAGPAVIQTATEQGCDFVLIGGYGHGDLVGVMFGSTLDQVLREFHGPVWVCS